MSYTTTEWENKQITAIQPYRYSESNHVNKLTRMIGLAENWILGSDSFICTKSGNYTIDCGQGHALKDDLYFNLFQSITLDIKNPNDYVRNTGNNILIDREDIFYICLDLQYVESDPPPLGRIKICKEKSEILATKTMDDTVRTRTVPRYLFLFAFGVKFDTNVNDYVVDAMYEKDPNDPSIYRRILDLRGFTEFLAYIRRLYGIDDLKIIPTTPNSNKVKMNSGFYIRSDSLVPLFVSSMISQEFDPITIPGNARYDLVIINDLKQLLIVKGTESVNPSVDIDIPFIPPKTYCLGIVRIHDTSNVVISELDIIDAREFFNKGNSEIEFIQETKTDWDTETETIQTLSFIPDLRKAHHFYQDRLHSLQFLHYQLINNLVSWDTIPTVYSDIIAKPKARFGAMLTFYKANNFDLVWEIPIRANINLANFGGADGLTMSDGNGYTLTLTDHSTIITFDTIPVYFTYFTFYAEGASDDGFDKMTYKTTWSGNSGDVDWNLNFDVDWNKPFVMIADSLDAENIVDFDIDPVDERKITFHTPPNRTQLICYAKNEQKVVRKVVFSKTDFESSPTDTVTLTEPIDASGLLYAVADKKILEPLTDFNIIDEVTIKFNFQVTQYVKLIYYKL